MKSKLLPIGSVVKLKDISFKVIIVGFRASDSNNPEKIYDYSGFIYPQGFLDKKDVLLFNNQFIESVLFQGYFDNEELNFKEKLYNSYYVD